MQSTLHDKEIHWVPLTKADIDRVDEIATHIHPTLPERREVFTEKVRLFPQGSFKFMFKGEMMGYATSHPWTLFSIPPLDDFLNALPDSPDCIYIHDVAVLPEARGHNAAGLFVELIANVAKEMHIKNLACVSVYGTDVLWARFGFRVVTSDEIELKLKSYGASATYMIADTAAVLLNCPLDR